MAENIFEAEDEVYFPFQNRYSKERWLILVIFITLVQLKRFVYNEEDGKFLLTNQNASFIFLFSTEACRRISQKE